MQNDMSHLNLNGNSWPVVKLGSVVENSNTNHAKGSESFPERFLGLEHINPRDFQIREFGNSIEGTSFTKLVEPGDTLFSKRRAYLRKVAVANFSAVCSGDILVFRAKNELLLPQLVPFVVSTNGFFQRALVTSAGSLSPRTSWKNLESYQFRLPPISVQREIIKLIEVLEKLKNQVYSTMVAARETRESLIAERFVSASPGYENVYLGDVFKLSNEKLGKHEIEPEVFSISKHDGIVLSSDYFDHRIASKDLDGYKILEPADWAYSTIHIDEGSIARNNTALSGVVSPMYTTMKWSSSDCDPGFFEVLLRSDVALNLYGNSAQGSVKRRKSLSFQRFASLKFSVPKLSVQIELLEKVSMLDRSIEALALQLKTIHSLELSIMSEVFDVDAI